MSRKNNAASGKLFWGWVAVEVLGAAWFGWQMAKAEARPWAKTPRRR